MEEEEDATGCVNSTCPNTWITGTRGTTRRSMTAKLSSPRLADGAHKEHSRATTDATRSIVPVANDASDDAIAQASERGQDDAGSVKQGYLQRRDASSKATPGSGIRRIKGSMPYPPRGLVLLLRYPFC